MTTTTKASNSGFRTASVFTLVAGLCWAVAGAVGFGASFLSAHASHTLPFLLLLAASGLALFAAGRQADHHRSAGILFGAVALVLAYAVTVYFVTPGSLRLDPGTIGLLILPAALAVGVLIEAALVRWRLQ